MPSSYDGARLRARLTTLLLSAAMALTAFVTIAPTNAHAATASGSQTSGMTYQQRFDNRAHRVLHVASNQQGDPYSYGAAGPSRFDCSGLVLYVFQHALGKSLPHNANMQMHRATRITRSQLRPGDLVFEVSGGSAYHVGIYAGHGYIWHAPHSGTVVKKQKMWHSNWRFGRLIHPRR